jgi:hypothetical protein
VRASYNSRGERVAPLPGEVPPPRDDDDGRAVMPPRKRELDAEGLASLHVADTRESRQRSDDDLLLDAVRQISASGRYVEEATGAPAAGLLGAGRLAGLAQHRAEAAAARLAEAGRLRRVEVRYLHARQLPGGGGRWVVRAGAAEVGRLRRLRAFEVKHHGRRKPPVELTTPPEPKPSRCRTTPEHSGGK